MRSSVNQVAVAVGRGHLRQAPHRPGQKRQSPDLGVDICVSSTSVHKSCGSCAPGPRHLGQQRERSRRSSNGECGQSPSRGPGVNVAGILPHPPIIDQFGYSTIPSSSM